MKKLIHLWAIVDIAVNFDSMILEVELSSFSPLKQRANCWPFITLKKKQQQHTHL